MDEENKNIEGVTESEHDSVAENVTEKSAEEAAVEGAPAAAEAAVEDVQAAEEAPVEDVQAAAEAVVEDVQATAEAAADQTPAQPTPIEVDNRKGMPRFALAAVLAVAVVVIAGILVLSLVLINSRGGGRYYKQTPVGDYPYANSTIDYDAFSKKYSDTTGQTVEELADSLGMEYEEFLMVYRLPKDLPKTFSANASECAIPVGRICELRKSTYEETKGEMGWGDDITEATPYGEAMDKTLLKNAVGEEYVDEFKTEVGLGDEVTGDTLFGDIRPEYEKYMKSMYDMQNATPAPTAEGDAATAATEAANADAEAAKAAENAEK